MTTEILGWSETSHIFVTALQIASLHGHNHIVRLLLDRGAEVREYWELDDGALYAASREGHVNIVRTLIDAGTKYSSPNNEALRIAREQGHRKIVKMLEKAYGSGSPPPPSPEGITHYYMRSSVILAVIPGGYFMKAIKFSPSIFPFTFLEFPAAEFLSHFCMKPMSTTLPMLPLTFFALSLGSFSPHVWLPFCVTGEAFLPASQNKPSRWKLTCLLVLTIAASLLPLVFQRFACACKVVLASRMVHSGERVDVCI